MKSIRLPSIISDGMVIQQETEFLLWGYASPEVQITVNFLNKTYTTQSDGKWHLKLDKAPAGGPYYMEIKASDGARVRLSDIYIGEVWLCSGQSNMELPMERLKDDFPEQWEPPVNSLIRQFKVPQEWDFAGPREELSEGTWTPAAPEVLHTFSGAAWFFAKKLYEKHKVPIGLINAALGGSPVEAWMSREALAPYPDKIAQGAQYGDKKYMQEIVSANEAKQQAWFNEVHRQDKGMRAPGWFSEPDPPGLFAKTLQLPGAFANNAGFPKGFCGVVWLRRDFEVPAAQAGLPAKVWLGTIIDADTVYINGVEIGNTTYRYPPRKYPVPAGLLRAGKNTITLRVVCNNGQGGVTIDKPFKIFAEKIWKTELAGSWNYEISAEVSCIPENFFIQWQPMGLYNAMIAPILDIPLRGVIWYQGESNDKNPDEYEELFKRMIEDWRLKKKQPALPFIFVQLPFYGEATDNLETSKWARIRAAQLNTLALPHTGMACILDLGEWNDLHPLNKKGVGERLELAAEALVYGEENTAPGPLLCESRVDGSRAILRFIRCAQGLVEKASSQGFTGLALTALCPGSSVRLPAHIEGYDSLVIDGLPEDTTTLLYAWADNPIGALLCNSEGLPAPPFRIRISSTN